MEQPAGLFSARFHEHLDGVTLELDAASAGLPFRREEQRVRAGFRPGWRLRLVLVQREPEPLDQTVHGYSHPTRRWQAPVWVSVQGVSF